MAVVPGDPSAPEPATGTGWSIARWSQEITHDHDVRASGAQLSQEVAAFERSMDWKERRSFTDAKAAFEKSLVEVTSVQASKAAKVRSAWKEKLGDGWNTFCDTANHYQSIFDVLNNQAPEYSTAVWGSIKLLLLVSVNSSKLKKGVVDSLDRLGDIFGTIKVLEEIQPTEKMVEAVTLVYVDSMKFLSEALRYYTENRAVSAYKKLLKPWELRFQQLVQKVATDMQRVHELMQIGNAINTRKILQVSDNLVEGQDALLQRQEVMFRSQLHYSEVHSKMLETVTGALQEYHGNDNQHSMFRQIEKQLETLISTVATEVQIATQNHGSSDTSLHTNETYISRYLHPRDTLADFIGLCFPLVDTRGKSLIRSIKQYSGRDVLLLQSASRDSIQAISDWINRITSEFLFLGCIQDSNERPWSEDLCLEIVGASNRFPAITTIYYFASAQSVPGIEALVQTLIYQIVDSHKASFSAMACRQHNITEERFRRSASDIYVSCDLLKDCVEVANAPLLYVVIDSYGFISSRAKEANLGPEKLAYVMEFLQKLCDRDSGISKILITSTSTQDKERFLSASRSSSNPNRLKHVQFTRGTNPDSMQVIHNKPTVRLPYKRGSNRVPEDPALLLELDELGLDSSEEIEPDSRTRDSVQDDFDWDVSIETPEGFTEKYLVDDPEDAIEGTTGTSDEVLKQIQPERGSFVTRTMRMSDAELSPHLVTAQTKSTEVASEHSDGEAWESDDSAFDLIPSRNEKKAATKSSSEKENSRGAERYLDSDSD